MHSQWLRIMCAALFLPVLSAATAPTGDQACKLDFKGPQIVDLPGNLHAVAIDDDCRRVFVANATRGRVEVFDVASKELVASIIVGPWPASLDFSPNGKRLYAASSGQPGPVTERVGSISIIDTEKLIETQRIRVAPTGEGTSVSRMDSPVSLAVAQNGRVLFSTSGMYGSYIKQMDPDTLHIKVREDSTVFTTGTTFLKASGDRSKIAFTSTNASTGPVTLYDSRTDAFTSNASLNDSLVADIALDRTGTAILAWGGYVLNGDLSIRGQLPGPARTKGVVVDPAGAIGYQIGAGLEVRDLNTFELLGMLNVGDSTDVADGFGTGGVSKMAISRDGALIVAITDHGLSFMRAADRMSSLTPQGPSPQAACRDDLPSPLFLSFPGNHFQDVVFSPDCRMLYASNAAMNRVEVFSLERGELRGSIQVGASPAGLDITPDGKTLYVANSGSASLSVIDLGTHTEARRIAVAPEILNDTPYSIAIAKNGRVLFTTTGLYGRMMEFNPATNAVTPRRDFLGANSYEMRLTASADRGVIGVAVAHELEGPLYRYVSDTDSFQRTAAGRSITNVALSRTGDFAVTTGLQLDGAFKVEKPLPTAEAGLAVSPDNSVIYSAAIGGKDILVIDRATGEVRTQLSAGDTSGWRSFEPRIDGRGQLAVSPDGKLVAVTTADGFSIIRPAGPVAPRRGQLQVLAFSATHPSGNQSLLRFMNTGGEAKSVHIALAEPGTGKALAAWDSPEIPPGATREYKIEEIAATGTFAAPWQYLVTVTTDMQGRFAHVLWNARSEAYTSASTCYRADEPRGKLLTHVANSLTSQSYVSVTNTEDAVKNVQLTVSNGADGRFLGRYTVPRLFPRRTFVIPVKTIEQQLDAGPLQPGASAPSYIISESSFAAVMLQHLVLNPHAGVLTDMTAACALPRPSAAREGDLK